MRKDKNTLSTLRSYLWSIFQTIQVSLARELFSKSSIQSSFNGFLREKISLVFLVNRYEIAVVAKLTEMHEFVVFVLAELLVEWQRFGVPESVLSGANDDNEFSFVAPDVLVKCSAIVEITEQKRKIPVPHQACVEEELWCDGLVGCQELQWNVRLLSRPPVLIHFESRDFHA